MTQNRFYTIRKKKLFHLAKVFKNSYIIINRCPHKINNVLFFIALKEKIYILFECDNYKIKRRIKTA